MWNYPLAQHTVFSLSYPSNSPWAKSNMCGEVTLLFAMLVSAKLSTVIFCWIFSHWAFLKELEGNVYTELFFFFFLFILITAVQRLASDCWAFESCEKHRKTRTTAGCVIWKSQIVTCLSLSRSILNVFLLAVYDIWTMQ